ncbi:MAG: glycosyltransferase family 2 protein [Eubacterium sp.]
MNTPLISIIVPVYNAEKYLDRCVESIVNQTYKNLEIILVDDGSPDNCPAMCDEWAKKDSRIKAVHKENGGAASSRNAGLDIATGEYVGFVDSDDYIDLDMYEIMLNQIVENEADAARCGVVRELGNGKTEEWGTGNHDVIAVDNKQLLADIGEAVGILPVSQCNKLFKRSCISDIRFDTSFKFAEDTLFNFMVAKNIQKMVYNDVDRYHYVDNELSVTSNDISENNFDEHRVMDVIFSLANEEALPHCIKGDVLKSFRTLRQIIESGKYLDRFDEIRNRIISNKQEIFSLPIYSKITKLRTLLLWLSPSMYKFAIKHLRK